MLTQIDERLVQYAKRPETGIKIVVIGGGTGLSTLLRGLKLFSNNITAIVTVADNGGSSGMLREDLGMIPPGDIRNCILALADTEPLMSDLLNYRFCDGRLKGQNFGNLLIAAMNAISENFYDAVRNVSKVLAVKGRVLPVSLQNINIGARLEDGSVIYGETEIGHRQASVENGIDEIFMTPSGADALPEAVEALLNSDLIVIGPGSLYTSIVPNLLFIDIVRAIERSRATKVFISNIMTQPAETLGYDAGRHLEAILKHTNKNNATGFIDYIVVNNAWIEKALIDRYRLESAVPVLCKKEDISRFNIKLVEAPLACINNGVIRHDHTSLAKIILRLAIEHLSDEDEMSKTKDG